MVVAQEAIHSMHTSGNKGMFIKLDMSKAYDRVEWSFLAKMMAAFGFSQDWIEWIMSCVSTSTYSMLIKGLPSQPFGAT